MDRALELALEGWGHTSPNPLVGAVLVRDGEVVGEGAHRRIGEEHAEIAALRAAADARGAVLYVNLEPCNHTGRTPPCVDAIIAAGVSRVVAAIADPNPLAGGGATRLTDAGIAVEFGVRAAEARELNAPFLHGVTSELPWVTLKLAVSLDAHVSDHTRSPGWLTSPSARRAVHRLRAGNDAIGVGMGTVLRDDPWLTVREWPAPRVAPTRIVFSRAGRLPMISRLARTAREVPVIICAEAPDPEDNDPMRQLGVEVLHAPLLSDALRDLRRRGLQSLLLEGGPHLAASFLAERLVQRLVLIQAPIVLGAGGLGAFSMVPGTTVDAAPRLRVVHREVLEDDVMTTYALD
jgi:diaminohydroxyphosphoribosylaminopyrimidine deaminase/5-amino-6-(5-phosphoribosylamino)uracil reductase